MYTWVIEWVINIRLRFKLNKVFTKIFQYLTFETCFIFKHYEQCCTKSKCQSACFKRQCMHTYSSILIFLCVRTVSICALSLLYVQSMQNPLHIKFQGIICYNQFHVTVISPPWQGRSLETVSPHFIYKGINTCQCTYK